MSESYTLVEDDTDPVIHIEREYWHDGYPAGTIVIELSREVLENMLSDVISATKTNNENTFRYQNVAYMATAEFIKDSCDGCFFNGASNGGCGAEERPPCHKLHRKDGKSIIWRRV